MISAGVRFGAATPHQLPASKPGTKSLIEGTPGSAGDRVAVVTARARSLPSRIHSIPWGMVSNMTWTCPASRSISAGAPPR